MGAECADVACPSSIGWTRLGQVARAVVEVDDEQRVLRCVAEAVCAVSGWAGCVVAIRDAEGLLHARATAGVSSTADRLLRNRPVPAAVYRRLWQAGDPTGVVRTVVPDHPVLSESAVAECLVDERQPGARRPGDEGRDGAEGCDGAPVEGCPLVLVPLMGADGEPVGFLNPHRPPPGSTVSDAVAACWAVLADLAVTALQMAAARATARSRGYLTDRLLRAAAGVRSSLQLDQVLSDIAVAMTATGGFHRVGLSLVSEDGTQLQTRATAGLSDGDAARLRANPTALAAMDPLMRPEMRVSRSYVFDHRYFDCPPELLAMLSIPDRDQPDADAGAGAGADTAGRWDPLDTMTVPLLDPGGALLGIISADEPWNGQFPDLAHIQALEFFADQAAVAIAQAHQHEQLALKSRTDALTGVANRQALLDRLPAALADNERTGGCCALLFCDLDHFKAVNDIYGHLAGDQVLRTVAEALAARLRAGDLLARYGGEEFVVLAPGTGPDEAYELAEQLRSRVAAVRNPGLSTELMVNISIGVAISTSQLGRGAPARLDWQEEAQALLVAADQALYEAKHDGRNRVCVAD